MADHDPPPLPATWEALRFDVVLRQTKELRCLDGARTLRWRSDGGFELTIPGRSLAGWWRMRDADLVPLTPAAIDIGAECSHARIAQGARGLS